MKLNSQIYLHDSDKAAMAALQAVPGFSQVVKAFMKIWSEQQFKIINMSTNLKLGPNQMPKYYNMLPPICEKLGIDIPEMYVTLDVTPNAYTWGDTHPFIVLHSGIFETVPEELIPTVIAHECGHIACHHALYTTIGDYLLKGASTTLNLLGISELILTPVKIAFSYWMRCSELSADRAASICDGTSEKTVDICMRFAGYDKDICAESNPEAFLEQAKEYRELVKDSKLSKALELLLIMYNDHPLNAVRALECKEWGESERFKDICDFLNPSFDTSEKSLPVELAPLKYIEKNINDVQADLMCKGFENIEIIRIKELDKKAKNGEVLSISINDNSKPTNDWYKKDSEIKIEYYEAKSEEEIALEHPNDAKMPENSKTFIGKNYIEVKEQFEVLGFSNISVKEMAKNKIIGFVAKENCVAKILINDKAQFNKGDWFPFDAEIIIYYYVSV